MAERNLRQIGQEWCKKEEIRVENALLLVTGIKEIPTEMFALALSERLPSLIEVYRRDEPEAGETLILCEHGDVVSKLRIGGEILIKVDGGTVCKVIRVDGNEPVKGILSGTRVSIKDLRERGLVREWRKAERRAEEASSSDPHP